MLVHVHDQGVSEPRLFGVGRQRQGERGRQRAEQRHPRLLAKLGHDVDLCRRAMAGQRQHDDAAAAHGTQALPDQAHELPCIERPRAAAPPAPGRISIKVQ